MKTMFRCLVDKGKTVTMLKRRNVLVGNFNAILLSSAIQKYDKSVLTRDVSIETVPPICFEFAFHIEAAIMAYCCTEVSKFVYFPYGSRRSW